MTVLEGLVLGVVQGVFMFVPVSSTSHLALTQHAFLTFGSAMPSPDAPETILFDVVVHVGTLVSVAVVMRRSLHAVVVGVVADVADRWGGPGQREGRYLRLTALAALTVVVTGVVGLAARGLLEAVFARPLAIAGTLAATGAVLWWTDRCGPRWRGLRQVTPAVAAGIGLAQALALAPGLSRSGLTIAAALAFGLRRRWAAEYSFLVAIPTILAIMAYQSLEVWTASRAGAAIELDVAPFAVGFVVAAVVGAAALKLVLALLYRARFRIFAVYVWALAVAVLLSVTTGLLPSEALASG